MWSGALIDHFSALTEQMVGMSKIYIAGRPLHENFLCHRAFCDFGPLLAAAAYRAPVRHIRLAKMPISAPSRLISRGKILNPMNPLGACFVSGVSFRGNPG